ncbi:hypothetical protein KKF84_04210 [Myxococcota bacterium]|nr:hypothetical protein [Myxococcota bacterium]MBU1534499.1 hypothetical protein [Myxococcota bacterium]
MKTILTFTMLVFVFFLNSCPFTVEQEYTQYYDIPDTYLKIDLRINGACEDLQVEIQSNYTVEQSLCNTGENPGYINSEYAVSFEYDDTISDEQNFLLLEGSSIMETLDVASLQNQCSLIIFPTYRADLCFANETVPLTVMIKNKDGQETMSFSGELTPEYSCTGKCVEAMSDTNNVSKEDIGACFVDLPFTHTLDFEEVKK